MEVLKIFVNLIWFFRLRDVVGFRFNKGFVFVKNIWFYDFVLIDIYRFVVMLNIECFSYMNL